MKGTKMSLSINAAVQSSPTTVSMSQAEIAFNEGNYSYAGFLAQSAIYGNTFPEDILEDRTQAQIDQDEEELGEYLEARDAERDARYLVEIRAKAEQELAVFLRLPHEEQVVQFMYLKYDLR